MGDIAPALHRPVLLLATDEVQAGIENREVARALQGNAGGKSMQRIEYTAVSDHHYPLASMPGCELGKDAPHALEQLPYAFTSGHRVIGIALLELRVLLRVLRLALCTGQALKYAQMAFSHPRLAHDFMAAAISDWLCGLQGASQIAAE